MRLLTILWTVLSLVAAPVQALERGSRDEARALAESAAQYLRAHGQDHAFPLFSEPTGRFVDRDLYVFVVSSDGVMLAHGGSPKTVGKNIWNLKDVDGQLIVQNAIRTANDAGAGWTPSYRFPDPLRKSLATKQSYVIRVDEVVLGVGFFRADC